jgi:hypothetical protein
MYYCWMHGLSQHRNHTSATCLHKADGHKDDATAFKMKGGNHTIASGRTHFEPASKGGRTKSAIAYEEKIYLV